MRKLLIFLLIIIALAFAGITYATSRIDDVVTKDDLPEHVYASDKTPEQGIEDSVLAMFNPLNTEDEYDLIESFINYVIYDSVKKNINEDYDPLGTCDTDACTTIITTDHASIKYAYAHLNELDQLILTVSIHRFNYPSFDTAIHLTFDIDIDVDIANANMALVLTLDSVYLADDEISESFLDRLLGFADTKSIEDSVTTGSLDLDEKTYHYTYTYTP